MCRVLSFPRIGTKVSQVSRLKRHLMVRPSGGARGGGADLLHAIMRRRVQTREMATIKGQQSSSRVRFIQPRQWQMGPCG